jgi:hypothetical protein
MTLIDLLVHWSLDEHNGTLGNKKWGGGQLPLLHLHHYLVGMFGGQRLSALSREVEATNHSSSQDIYARTDVPRQKQPTLETLSQTMFAFLECLLLCLVLVSPVSAKGPAGNENYAAKARSLLKSSMIRRNPGISSQVASVSFTVGQGDTAKDYLSPIGPRHKSYTLTSDWGLDSLAATMMPVTVFTVEGEVTCDVLGVKLANFTGLDDVFDQVNHTLSETTRC